jgi:hypothetical protein
MYNTKGICKIKPSVEGGDLALDTMDAEQMDCSRVTARPNSLAPNKPK